MLPLYLKLARSLDELIPWLYLRGVSTGNFQDALQALVGEQANGQHPPWECLKVGVVLMRKTRCRLTRAMSAQKRWRKLRGFKQLADVIAGVKFIDGIDERQISRQAAA